MESSSLQELEHIPGVEKAVEGMNVGESKTVKVAPEEAYGQRIADRVVRK